MVNSVSMINRLAEFYRELHNYGAYRTIYLAKRYTEKQYREMMDLREWLVQESGAMGPFIAELTGKETVTSYEFGQPRTVDMWAMGLRVKFDKATSEALNICIDYTNRAIGKFRDDINKGIRDKQGNEIKTAKIPSISIEQPKAFIAHEGETKSLNKLKKILEALDIKCFIAEAEASDGRSIERQVDWTQAQGDFAIILATKGKAINRKTGKPYMGLNVADELGRARAIFKNKIILLLEKGVEPHTNISEIVHERFNTQSMDEAFTKIVKELRNWKFIEVGKFEE